MSSSYTKEHLEDALTWVERNVHDGIRIVAGALSATYPDDDSPPLSHSSGCDYPDACAHPSHVVPSVVQNVATIKAEEVAKQFTGTDVLVLVVDGDVIRVGACIETSTKERVADILSQSVELLRGQA